MIRIQKIIYMNERGEELTLDFKESSIDYRKDRVEDLLREMVAGDKLGPKIDEEKAKRMGPPPRPEEGDGDGEKAAWGEGFEF